jgi:hypothetical protein
MMTAPILTGIAVLGQNRSGPNIQVAKAPTGISPRVGALVLVSPRARDIAGEVLDRAFDADDNLSDDTKRFIDRHVTSGEKRPPAPSLRRGADHALRVGGRKTGA